MNSVPVSGSSLWQTVFVSFAVVLLLLQVLRGWRLGLPRQLVRLAALVIAYAVALFCGQMLLPLLRPILKAPDFVLSALGGAILAALVYVIINTTGAILFKRTSQQESRLVRLVYGISGAAFGVVFGLVFIWMVIVGIRSIGAVAEAEVSAGTPRVATHRTVAKSLDENSLSQLMARLKRSLELGHVGDVVKQTDVIPTGIYDTLSKVGEVFAKPERAARFLSYPGVTELADNPKILALRADPQIQRMLEEGRLWELLQDDRLIEAANDPELAKQVKKFDLKKALDYATQK
ncbi:MAG: CvpA family protein [Verrucomicrobiota bacterium]|nr:CvpA family protein [Verrucomicrobiota bacterium]